MRINVNGTWTQVTDHSGFVHAHQVAKPDSSDIAHDGNPYSMVRSGRDLIVVEANQAQVLRESLNGHIERVLDVTATVGNITPTAVARRANGFIVGNLGKIPFFDSTSVVFNVLASGAVGRIRPNFTTVLGLAYDNGGKLYALETSTNNSGAPPFLFPNSGQVVLVDDLGPGTAIATGLNLPTAMTFGPDGALYVVECGYGCGPGGGFIVRIPH